MMLRPQPPLQQRDGFSRDVAPFRMHNSTHAFELRRKTNSSFFGSLNWSTSFWRLPADVLPSSRITGNPC